MILANVKRPPLIRGYVDQQVLLPDLSWIHSTVGKYYADGGAPNIPSGTIPLFCVMYDFSNLKETDNVIPYIYLDHIYVMGNTDTYHSVGGSKARLYIRTFYG